MQHSRVIGCAGYSHIPKEIQTSKLEPRAEKCVLMSYKNNGYKLYDPITKKFIISRDVILNEQEFFYKQGFINFLLHLTRSKKLNNILKIVTNVSHILQMPTGLRVSYMSFPKTSPTETYKNYNHALWLQMRTQH